MFSFLAPISFLIVAVWKAKANLLMKAVFERGDQKEHYCCFRQIKSGWKITHPLGHLPFSGGSFRIHIISSTIWKATLNFFTLITSCSKTNKNWNLWLPSESVHVCSFKKTWWLEHRGRRICPGIVLVEKVQTLLVAFIIHRCDTKQNLAGTFLPWDGPAVSPVISLIALCRSWA